MRLITKVVEVPALTEMVNSESTLGGEESGMLGRLTETKMSVWHIDRRQLSLQTAEDFKNSN